MAKIEKLTKEQESKFQEYVKKWLKIGLNTDRIDKKEASKAVDNAYINAGLKPPKNKIFVKSVSEGTKEVKKIGDYVYPLYGSMDAGWLSFYDYFISETNVKDCEKIIGLLEVSKTCGWVWVFENTAIITDRPSLIKFDDNKRLHSETGPAIQYVDGTCIYCWHGVKIPGDWIKNKHLLLPQDALKIVNMDQRKAACEILGWNNIIKQLKGKIVDKNKDPQIGTLIECEIPGVGKEKFLQVTCGTGRQFSLIVPPNMKTAIEANAWTYNLEADEYRPEIRT